MRVSAFLKFQELLGKGGNRKGLQNLGFWWVCRIQTNALLYLLTFVIHSGLQSSFTINEKKNGLFFM